jgi:gliding-associated putative ABC transporter substrate-binding component GldG
MNRRVQEIVTGILTIGIVVLVALNSSLFFFRLDLTENKAFTISEVSRNLFTEIPEQVSITYYLSERLRNRAVETQQIVDILNEYAAYSRGTINVDVVDPAEEGVTQRVQQLGVAPQQIQVIEEDQQSLARVYTGIVIDYLDRQETLPVVFDPSTIEYRLTSTIRNLVEDERDVVGLLLGNDDAAMQEDFQLLGNQLSESFEVRPIEQGQDIPPEVSVLFVIGGAGLEEFDLYPIDQYIMSGGNVFFAVDGVTVDLQRSFTARAPENMPVLDMLEGYGARVEQELVLDTSNKRIPIRRPAGGIMVQTLEPYPHWVSLRSSGANRQNVITARFSGLDLYWPSPISLERENAEVLLETTSESWLMQDQFTINPNQGFGFRRNREDTLGSYVVGATLSGSFDSYFADGRIPTREGVERDWTDPTTSVDQARMVIVGDSDFPSNILQFTESRYNLDFTVNALTWLSNEEDLLQIKTRTTRDMRLNAIPDPGVEQSVARVAEFVNIYVMPLLVIAYGVVRFMRRRERAQRKSGGE